MTGSYYDLLEYNFCVWLDVLAVKFRDEPEAAQSGAPVLHRPLGTPIYAPTRSVSSAALDNISCSAS